MVIERQEGANLEVRNSACQIQLLIRVNCFTKIRVGTHL